MNQRMVGLFTALLFLVLTVSACSTPPPPPASDSWSVDGSDVRNEYFESHTMLGERAVSERHLEIDLVSSQGTSVLRDIINTTGSGEVPTRPNSSTGELVVRTGNQSGSKAVLETANMGRYTPGSSAQAGIGLRTLEKPTGDMVWRAGYFDENDGFFFGQNNSCLFVAIRNNGDTTRVCRSDWNGENINDTLGRSWNMQDGTILQIDYTWYGYGAVRFSIVETKDITSSTSGNVQDVVTLHTFTPLNTTSISNPMQRLRVEVENGGTSEDYEVRVGGRQYSVYGEKSPTKRVINTGVTSKTVNSSEFTCLMALQKDTNDTFRGRELLFYGLSALSDSENTEFSVFFNPNVTTTGSFSSPRAFPTDETSLRTNKNCSFVKDGSGRITFDTAGGLEVWSELVAAASQGSNQNPGGSSVTGVNVKLPVERGMAVGARSLTGASTTVDVNVRFIERR